MRQLRPDLVSVDVGGTLGRARGCGLTTHLVRASPLAEREARALLRDRLHTRPALTDDLIAEVCGDLGIPVSAFPRVHRPAPFEPYPGTADALRSLSRETTVVTLSNVACPDADTDGLRAHFHPWISGFYPSCHLGYAKPDRRAFLTIAAARGTAPDRLLHIGDDWQCDVLGAIAAGVPAVWISHGRPAPDHTLLVEHGVAVANDFPDAVHHILALPSRSTA